MCLVCARLCELRKHAQPAAATIACARSAKGIGYNDASGARRKRLQMASIGVKTIHSTKAGRKPPTYIRRCRRSAETPERLHRIGARNADQKRRLDQLRKVLPDCEILWDATSLAALTGRQRHRSPNLPAMNERLARRRKSSDPGHRVTPCPVPREGALSDVQQGARDNLSWKKSTLLV